MSRFKLKQGVESKLILVLHSLEHRVYKMHRFTLVKCVLSFVFSVLNHAIIQGIFNCVIPKEVNHGKNLCIPHPFNIVFSPCLVIGDNIKIMHGVTIGINELSSDKVEGIKIGNDVYIGCNASIIGNSLRIGNNVTIGANAAVITNVPDGATAVGVPARIIKK